jgi:hypothetical protein
MQALDRQHSPQGVPHIDLCCDAAGMGTELTVKWHGVFLFELKCTVKKSWRMPSSGMRHHVALVRTDGSEKHIASIIRVTRIGEIETTLAITDSCHPHEGGDTFLWTVGSYKSHMVSNAKRWHSSTLSNYTFQFNQEHTMPFNGELNTHISCIIAWEVGVWNCLGTVLSV